MFCSETLTKRSSFQSTVDWMFVCCECFVLSGRGLCDELITRPEESYRLWCVVVCDQETSETRRLKPATGLWKIQPQWVETPRKQTNKQTNKQNSTMLCSLFKLMRVLVFKYFMKDNFRKFVFGLC
jgi:hypothetical protein